MQATLPPGRWGGGGYLLLWEEFNVLPWSAIPGHPVTAIEPLLKSHLDSKGNVYPETGAELVDWAVFSFETAFTTQPGLEPR